MLMHKVMFELLKWSLILPGMCMWNIKRTGFESEWLLSVWTCCRTGFEEERIEALLHKIEIQMKHQSTSFGLALASVSETHTCTVWWNAPIKVEVCFKCFFWFFFCVSSSILHPAGIMMETQYSCWKSVRMYPDSDSACRRIHITYKTKSSTTLWLVI